MACDFSVAGDHARFGQAGPVHGSAPDGGSTDFLHLYIGWAKAAESMVLCEAPWSAHKALRLGAINDIVPVHRKADGTFVANPLVITDTIVDSYGRPALGESKMGDALAAGKAEAAACTIDLSQLDAKVQHLVTQLTYTFPDCTRKSLESLRKKKLEHWYQNGESNRSWLSLNMNTEAAAGFPAFHYGDRNEREIDFVAWRLAIADGHRVNDELTAAALKPSARRAWAADRGGEA